ncbi:winged helix-turn-helix domain-containing protein [Roseovarius sp.]|uniref:restriction endonuclease n=1 Tax=Roseovarius sp. TaxID=1486281 RepID=UPI0026327733|nr:winged helix-turn-helix domain-containing protein [Roseovarius sp.]
MIPDYQSLMKPVLELAASGEVKISDAVTRLEEAFQLSEGERSELLPSGKQARFANRVHWARSYLKQAGLLRNTRRGHFEITEEGRRVLAEGPERIDAKFLERYDPFLEFKSRTNAASEDAAAISEPMPTTPDEAMRGAYEQINDALAADLLARLREAEPAFFEGVIVHLLLQMGYGYGASAGNVLGRSGDDGVDGVINLDPLGVDQVYVQAKRYQAGSPIGSGAIRDFYGALGLKDVTKGIFVTTSSFSPNARATAEKLGARIVLVDGPQLAKLMVVHEVGCRVTEAFKVAVVEESYFE